MFLFLSLGSVKIVAEETTSHFSVQINDKPFEGIIEIDLPEFSLLNDVRPYHIDLKISSNTIRYAKK